MSGPIRLSAGATAVFGTRTLGLLLSAVTTFVLARLLGPADLGAYYLLTLVPPSMLALLSFGLPAALTYFAGRGASLDEIRTLALILALVLSSAIVLAVFILQPLLTSTVLAAAPSALIPVAALAVPGTFVASFCMSVILGRQRLRVYNALFVTQALALFLAQLFVVGIAHGGLVGAMVTYIGVTTGIALASAAMMLRLAPFRAGARAATARPLLRFGIALQPASLSGFFSYRADVFLMSVLLRDPTALGVYGVAVSLAELCFYIPDSISTVLFPRVAASDRATAAELVPTVSRIALLLTGTVALTIACGTLVGFPLLLPAYIHSVPPTLILLPGIVGLSASKVLSGYLSGIGRPGPVSVVASATLLLNLVINIVLIPRFGPAGAATASLVSYSTNGVVMVALGAREAGVPVSAMILLRRTDLVQLRRMIMAPLQSRSFR